MDIGKVIDKNSSTIMAIPGVTGVGAGSRNGKPAIVVLVKQLTRDLSNRLPESLEGYEVVIEQSGEITAF